jgi:hypothetical protein
MSLLSGPVCMKASGNHFFHCDKENGGCGHISHHADTEMVHTSKTPLIGKHLTADAAAWVNTTCEMCGKPVTAT